jgi:hypothetical protein
MSRLAKNRRLKSPIPNKRSVREHSRLSGGGLGMGKARLMRGDTVVMAKTTNDPERDVAGDVAEAVGSAIGGIVNEIEQLDKRRAELIRQLQRAADSVNAQLSKWLPAGITEMPRKAKESYNRARKDAPCSVCGFKTEPPHDARSHAQQNPKGPFTASELADRKLERVP